MFTIIRTSPRGAKLITDGTRQCWIQSRWMRPDGTLTPAGLANWANARLNSEVEDAQRAREQARQSFAEAQKAPVTVLVRANILVGESDKAFKCWTGAFQTLYGKRVKCYDYLPKSLVSAVKEGEDMKITMPRWLFNKNGWIGNVVTDCSL